MSNTGVGHPTVSPLCRSWHSSSRFAPEPFYPSTSDSPFFSTTPHFASHRAALMVLFDLTFHSTEVRVLGPAISVQRAHFAIALLSNAEPHGLLPAPPTPPPPPALTTPPITPAPRPPPPPPPASPAMFLPGRPNSRRYHCTSLSWQQSCWTRARARTFSIGRWLCCIRS